MDPHPIHHQPSSHNNTTKITGGHNVFQKKDTARRRLSRHHQNRPTAETLPPFTKTLCSLAATITRTRRR